MNKGLCLEKNIGSLDRTIRIVVGSALILYPAYAGWSPWAIAILAAIGGMWIVEGIIRY